MIILWTVDMAYLKEHAIKYVIYCDKVDAHSILYLFSMDDNRHVLSTLSFVHGKQACPTCILCIERNLSSCLR